MARTWRSETLVVGAGHAGVAVAVALTKVKGTGSVTLIGDEDQLPYERPALSKQLLYGQARPDPVLLRSPEYWERSPIELRLGERVVAIDPVHRRVRTDSGATSGYRRLVWAAGGRAARTGLAGEDLTGVHTLRSFADLTALKAALARARSVVVVGGGYLGLEAAAGLRTLGLAVTVIEAAPRLLARVTGPVVSDYFTTLHRAHGVDVRLGLGVDAVLGAEGRVNAVRLGDGTTLAADIVILGVGMAPVVGPLLEAGADGDRSGIEVDGQCRTSLADVFAVGDCARQSNPYSPSPQAATRIESVHNTGQHAAAVARSLADLAPADPVPPRVWSTQYDDELRSVGLPTADDEQLVRGDPASADFSVLYLRGGRLAAVDAVNRPRDFARAQALVAARWEPPSGAAVTDPGVDLPRP
jgi:3-phenylpropionate/trans-cinnamate dioxygenase ferredoxin reductase subunit